MVEVLLGLRDTPPLLFALWLFAVAVWLWCVVEVWRTR